MTERYTKNYRILGVHSGTSWKELRKAYKSLVNAWHPDRFQRDVHQKRLAEEKTKEITQSYKELADYYKKFGILPPTTDSPVDSLTQNIAPQSTSVAQPAPEDTEPSGIVVTPAEPPQSSRSSHRVGIAMALAGVAYFIWQVDLQEKHDYPPVNKASSDKVAGTQNDGNLNHHTQDEKSQDEKYFGVGSSIGEVYTAQGVPTNTEENIWSYGSSKVYFDKGRVLRWEESPDNPLRTKMSLKSDKPSMTFFGVGSTKKEVMVLQGVPDRDAGNVWDYGVSSVYFENDRVKYWNESPLNPLKVRR